MLFVLRCFFAGLRGKNRGPRTTFAHEKDAAVRKELEWVWHRRIGKFRPDDDPCSSSRRLGDPRQARGSISFLGLSRVRLSLFSFNLKEGVSLNSTELLPNNVVSADLLVIACSTRSEMGIRRAQHGQSYRERLENQNEVFVEVRDLKHQ